MTGRSRLAEVVRAFGVDPARIRRIPRGYVNTVWLVDAGAGRYVLKRATDERATSDLAFEHALLEHLHAAGWNVPNPVAGPSGTLVDLHGSQWWLMPFLPGRAPAHKNARYGRWAGTLLAELHGATAGFDAQDPDDLRLRAVADWPFYPDRATLRSSLPRLEGVAAPVARAVEAAVTDLEARLADVPVQELNVTHFDFHHDNLRVHRGTVAVIDFDFAHTDEAIADIATALHFTPDPVVAHAFIEGYDSVRRLTAGEVRMIPALYDARKLLHAAWLMTRPDVGSVLGSIEQTLRELGDCPLR